MDLPTSDVEDLILIDYLPLPIYDATEVATFDGTIAGTIPPAGVATYGPLHTLDTVIPATDPPMLTNNGDANTVSFNFGDFDTDPSVPSTVDILLTVTALDVLMADGLALTNQVFADFGSTNAGNVSSAAITPVVISAPEPRFDEGHRFHEFDQRNLCSHHRRTSSIQRPRNQPVLCRRNH